MHVQIITRHARSRNANTDAFSNLSGEKTMYKKKELNLDARSRPSPQ